MAFASFDSKNAGAPMAEINMVPLIDVMLVLLVIFIVTAPLLTQAVKLELPQASSKPNIAKVDKIESNTRTSVTSVLVTLVEGVTDTGQEFDDIKMKLDTISLPQGAGPIVFLLSDAASFISGIDVLVDGGMMQGLAAGAS